LFESKNDTDRARKNWVLKVRLTEWLNNGHDVTGIKTLYTQHGNLHAIKVAYNPASKGDGNTIRVVFVENVYSSAIGSPLINSVEETISEMIHSEKYIS
jgi:hypothetical protein